MKILFYKTSNSVTGYRCEMVTSSTFKFGEELYFIGFFQPIEDTEEYRFEKEYFVNIKFPSIDYETYCKCKRKWGFDTKLDICMGNKVIGTGKLVECTFSTAV